MRKILLLTLLAGAISWASAQSSCSKNKASTVVIQRSPTVRIVTRSNSGQWRNDRDQTIRCLQDRDRNRDRDRNQHDNHKEKEKRKRYDRLTLQIGGGGNYAWGQISDQVPSEFNRDLLSGQAQGFFGIRFDVENRRRPNVVGVWGTYGFQTPQSVNSIFRSQELDFVLSENPTILEIREWEAGLLLRNWFRLSGGMGTLNFVDSKEELQSLNYYTATAGLGIKLGKSLKWVTNGTVMLGRDFENFTFRPSTGLVLNFDFLRI
ncbi:MAG: hypothetical protein KDD63_04260 [Bacteroidetes bacterium]|nr:hypothetical protein [Bacteroidota bacterium]